MWIEIEYEQLQAVFDEGHSPCAGVWLEIKFYLCTFAGVSLPARGCELKCALRAARRIENLSLPMGEYGLKLLYCQYAVYLTA